MSLNASLALTLTAKHLTPKESLRAGVYVATGDDDPNPGSFYFPPARVADDGTVSWRVPWAGLAQYATNDLPYKLTCFVFRPPDFVPITDLRGQNLCLSFDVWEAYSPEPCEAA